MKKLIFVTVITLLLVFTLPLTALATDATDTSAATEPVTDAVTEATTETTTLDDTTAETEPEQKTNFGFYPGSLMETAPLMGMGMLGIFLVTLTIILTVLVLRWIGDKLDAKKNED